MGRLIRIAPSCLLVLALIPPTTREECFAAEKPVLTAELAETLRWFPANTHAIVVARDFDFDNRVRSLNAPEDGETPLITFLRESATGRLGHDGVERALEGVAGRRVEHAVMAGRQFMPVIAFGAVGYAGCHVVRFTTPLGDDAAKLTEALRKEAPQIVSLAGRDVAAFVWKFPKEPYIKDQPWEELLVVLPEANDRELILATQRTMLDETLARRANHDAPRVALPPNLSIWNSVDPTAAAWAILAATSKAIGHPSTTRVISWEYHLADDTRFVLVSPLASLPEVDLATLDPSTAFYTAGPLAFASFLTQTHVPFTIDRTADRPVRLTVPLNTSDEPANAMRGFLLTYSTRALFAYCIEP